MENKTCNKCLFHEFLTSEVNGTIYDDGCICNHKKGNNEYHFWNCSNYVMPGEEYLGCPSWITWGNSWSEHLKLEYKHLKNFKNGYLRCTRMSLEELEKM